MLFEEGDTELLKTWLIKKLETVAADADSDVLAEYVLALIKTDDSVAVSKANCTEQLKDFLLDDSERFVDQLFAAIAAKTYDPSRPPPRTAAPIYKPPQRASHDVPEQFNQGRKRGYHDWDRDESQLAGYDGGERPVKQARRGRGRQQHGNNGSAQLPQMPTPPPGIPPFDPNNPMATFMAMQHMMGLLPGFPPPNGNPPPPRCIDYDTKGYCALGASCLYDHGGDAYVLPANQDYDPNQPSLLHISPSRRGTVHMSPGRGRGGQKARGGNHNTRGGGNRVEFSQRGPNHDKSNTTIVVEQIPPESYDEQSVRDFFQAFGNIEDVTMIPNRQIAVVKYDNFDAANAAYNSPKVVFENRFVKVYWYKSDNPKLNGQAEWTAPAEDEEMQDQEPEIDLEEVARKQEEAQKKHEERKKKLEEAAARQKAIDELEANRKKALAEIARKTNKNSGTEKKETEKSRGLKEMLAKLEAEAKQMGIDPDAVEYTSFHNSSPPSYRGRGGYRGRSRGRGSYTPSYRGGYGGPRGGAVMRLDNRPKTVCVIFNEGSFEDHQEALRQLLFFHGSDSAVLTKHPDRKDAALVTFQERYLGETFMAAASSPDFSLAGKCELTWYTATKNVSTDADIKMVISDDDPGDRETSPGREMDDVADDDDRWG